MQQFEIDASKGFIHRLNIRILLEIHVRRFSDSKTKSLVR